MHRSKIQARRPMSMHDIDLLKFSTVSNALHKPMQCMHGQRGRVFFDDRIYRQRRQADGQATWWCQWPITLC